MAFNLGGLAGLYKGYEEAEGTAADIEGRQLMNRQRGMQLQEGAGDQAGQQAFGNALRLMFGGAGAQGPPPMPPQPGQASMPAGGPPQGPAGMPPPMPGGAMMSQQPMAQQMPPMQGGGMGPPPGPGGPGGPPPGPMPGGPPPMGPGGPGGPPGGAPGGQQGQPQLDLPTIIQAVTKSNPGAPPGVIAKAVDRFMPLMNVQAQMMWRQKSLELREQAESGRNTRFDAAEQGRDTRSQNRASGAGGVQTPFKQFIAKKLETLPEDATPADIANAMKEGRTEWEAAGTAGKPKSAAETKITQQQQKYDNALTTIDDALLQLKEGLVAGFPGKATRISEIMGNIAGWSDKTKANEFQQKILLLQTVLPSLLTGRAITGKDERERVGKIVAGLSAGDTSQITTADLLYLSKVMKRLRPEDTTKGKGAGAGVDVDAATKAARDAGYSDEEIAAYKKKKGL